MQPRISDVRFDLRGRITFDRIEAADPSSPVVNQIEIVREVAIVLVDAPGSVLVSVYDPSQRDANGFYQNDYEAGEVVVTDPAAIQAIWQMVAALATPSVFAHRPGATT